MPMPEGIGIVDLMLDIPAPDNEGLYDFLRPLLRDRESRENFEFPAEYMFKEVPAESKGVSGVEVVLEEMDRWGIEKALIGLGGTSDEQRPHVVQALRDHPTRFYPCVQADPNRGMDALRDIQWAHEHHGARAVQMFPAGCNPQVPINDKKMFPIYAKCVELELPVLVCAGVPGPRVPMGVQDVALIDEVCWSFPELKFVTRHGCEPWTELAVKLMLKWPNLYYSTSAFAPKYYPKAIIDYANTRGADKIMYAGYFPIGLSLERIMTEMRDVPLKDEVWPKFLRENALRVFDLD
ncbi:MAG: amidohydrolase family protein [Acidimicrobiia bacterium]|nr:amidohydrolase family protein [Acidimicrobiia bacterium]